MHSNVTIKNVSWPHFSWPTLYIKSGIREFWCPSALLATENIKQLGFCSFTSIILTSFRCKVLSGRQLHMCACVHAHCSSTFCCRFMQIFPDCVLSLCRFIVKLIDRPNDGVVNIYVDVNVNVNIDVKC